MALMGHSGHGSIKQCVTWGTFSRQRLNPSQQCQSIEVSQNNY